MRVLSESTLNAYALLFWGRQAAKRDPNDQDALADIKAAGDPVKWLRCSYPYKLPDARNDVIRIVKVETREELDGLLVHDYVPCDDWMRARNLVPIPYARKLGQLARTFLDREYFATPRNDRQYLNYCTWRSSGSLSQSIGSEDRPLIEAVELDGKREYEIVDGWGRLLPFAALLCEGLAFHAFEAFLASRQPTKLS